jgi:hypothetical protein
VAVVDVHSAYLRALRERPFPEQEAFARDPARLVAAFAAVRSGKTYGAARKFAMRLLRDVAADVQADGGVRWKPRRRDPMESDQPRRLYWVIAPTYGLANLAWQEVLAALYDGAADLILHETEGRLWLRTGHKLERRTAEKERNLQGAEVSGALADEICSWRRESWYQLKNRLASVRGWLVAAGSPRPGTWPQSEWWDRRSVGGPVSCHTWGTAANPYFPAEELAEARNTLPEKWYKRDFEASWNTFAGLVYDMLGEANYIDADPAAESAVDLALDFGYHHPACLFLASRDHAWDADGNPVDGRGGIVIDEIVREQIRLPELLPLIAQRLKARGWALRNVYCDKAGNQASDKVPWTTVDAVKAGLPIQGRVVWPTKVEQISIATGVLEVAARLRAADGTTRLRIAEHLRSPRYLATLRSPGIVGSLRGYVYPDSDKARADEPLKDGVHDHFADALRYWAVCERPVVRYDEPARREPLRPVGDPHGLLGGMGGDLFG